MSESYTKVIASTIGRAPDDLMMVVRHYTGSGVYTNLTEVYVIRDQKFLGRFENDVFVISAEHPKKPAEADLKEYRAAYLVLKAASEKLWK